MTDIRMRTENDSPLMRHLPGEVEARYLTWKEAYEAREEERILLSKWLAIPMNLNRCEHGRHEEDVCSSCGGPSHGNPLIRSDRVIGFTIDGDLIRVPERGEFDKSPDLWIKHRGLPLLQR